MDTLYFYRNLMVFAVCINPFLTAEVTFECSLSVAALSRSPQNTVKISDPLFHGTLLVWDS